jgi:methionyl-tRNA synthetase
MPDTPNKFYLTTPIYYVNARPHIGHAYSTIAADVIARRHRLLGDDTFFLTGTDEHGQKVQRSAEKAGIPPQQFADEVSATFEALWKRMGITNDDYIRTTDVRHKRGVQKLWRTLVDRGAIYLSSYTGQYSIGAEAFVEGPPGTIDADGRLTETVTEENYFFKLSEYQQPILDLIESNQLHIQPEAIRNEVLSFLRGGLKDLSISRTSFTWGIPVPGNEKHVVYVWFDALANYMTAIGYGSDDPAAQAKFAKYWPADLHLLGKEIARFHCVYWPAFLMAAGLPLPKSMVANGWLLFEESKMSKSRGNVVRTETILDAFGEQVYAKQFPDSTKQEQDLFASDVIRYFLLREIPFGQDGNFSFDALVTRYNADLVNGFGNLVSRTLTLATSHLHVDTERPTEPWLCEQWLPGPDDKRSTPVSEALSGTASVIDEISNLINVDFDFYMRQSHFHLALSEVFSRVSIIDGYLSWHKPWLLAKSDGAEDRKKLVEVLYTAAESIRIITALLYPVMPYATASVWAQLGLGSIEDAARNGELKNLQWGSLKPGTKLGPLAPIFPRADKGLAQIMIDMENPATSASDSAISTTAPATASTTTAATATASTTAPASANTTATAPTRTGADAAGSSGASVAGPSPAETATAEIGIDDFVKVDLRVGQIVVAERIPKADKLLRLEVELGSGFTPSRRQILSGIAEWYTPEELIGRRIAVIANLAPRKMRGLESHGMLLAASDDAHTSKPILATFSDEVPLGWRIR